MIEKKILKKIFFYYKIQVKMVKNVKKILEIRNFPHKLKNQRF